MGLCRRHFEGECAAGTATRSTAMGDRRPATLNTEKINRTNIIEKIIYLKKKQNCELLKVITLTAAGFDGWHTNDTMLMASLVGEDKTSIIK